MKIRRIKVRIAAENDYWRSQVRRLSLAERSLKAGKRPRLDGDELVFASLTEMARALTPRRIEVLRLIRRHQPSSVRALAGIARRDVKNVSADVTALEMLGLVQSDGRRTATHRKAPHTELDRIEVRVDL